LESAREGGPVSVWLTGASGIKADPEADDGSSREAVVRRATALMTLRRPQESSDTPESETAFAAKRSSVAAGTSVRFPVRAVASFSQ